MKKWMAILLMITSMHCRDAYNVILKTNGDGVLVIEGILNGNGRTTIKLSRTTRLSDKRIAPETGAILFIEGQTGGVTYPMLERDKGEYVSDSIVFDLSDKYRLNITTSDNRKYASEYKNFIITPPIDALTWAQDDKGVTIFSNSHDNGSGNQYYKWDDEETWEFKSSFRASIGFRKVIDTIYTLEYLLPSESVDDRLYTCWNSRNSSTINLVTTQALDSNVLYYPVKFIPRASIELSFLYSILIKETAISQDGFDFYTRMKKNTESIGSIFDAQPSELSGNVKCLTDSSELVVGYVEASTMESKRLFIDSVSLKGWGYDQGCVVWFDRLIPYPYSNDPNLFKSILDKGLLPTVPASTEFGAIKTFWAERAACVDCRLRGVHAKPDFWP